MFLISMATAIVTLLWSVLLFVDLHNTTTYVCLNLSMMFSWVVLCVVFVQKELYPKKKNRSTLLEVLIHV